jgi:hypothetical protein
MKKIKLAWGEYFALVKGNLDKEGWYDGSNDSPQLEFPNIEVTKARFHQRPTSLSENVKTPLDVAKTGTKVVSDTIKTTTKK